MMLAIDIGNTTVSLGLFAGGKLLKSWRIKTDREKTADEHGVLFTGLFRNGGYDVSAVEGAIISSVVPPLTPVIEDMMLRTFGVRPLIVGQGLKTGMPILYENPHEVGADRIAGAVGAYERYGGPVIVVDFGTATTFDVVSAQGEYLGGAIAPGIQIAAEALYLKTARLPRIEIKKPPRVIGKTTVSSMQSGLYYGYTGLVTRMIEEIRREIGEESRAVATGGFGLPMVAEVKSIETYDPDLLLEGLRILYDRNR